MKRFKEYLNKVKKDWQIIICMVLSIATGINVVLEKCDLFLDFIFLGIIVAGTSFIAMYVILIALHWIFLSDFNEK